MVERAEEGGQRLGQGAKTKTPPCVALRAAQASTLPFRDHSAL